MKKVLIFAGTTEGRQLIQAFDRSNIACHVCVATEYGNQMLKTSDAITVHTGRLDEAKMKQLIENNGYQVIVDATHPYAVKVTEQIKALTTDTDITYIRLNRENEGQFNEGIFYESAKECAEALARTSGRILLTTGSKELPAFTEVSGLRERIVVRVIPAVESINLCYAAGLQGNQIIAMQGPFSQEMNETIIREYDIEHLVTKESGINGGTLSKYEAAKKLGIKLHVLRRPEEIQNSVGLSFEETIDYLERIMGLSLDRGSFNIALVGIGPGNQGMMTKEVEEAISEADVIFGANRMIDSVQCKASKYPFYLKADIIPVLEKLYKERYQDTKVVILFSGDTGFFSGSKKLYEALLGNTGWNVKVLPGISSVSALCARFGLDWQDGEIISLHGISKDIWSAKILDSIKYNSKTFFITSGVADINELGKLLESESSRLVIKLGYQLTYDDEQLLTLTAKECESLEKDGLYCGVIIAKEVTGRCLVPVLSDDYFIRDKVPMTKEDIRKLSICEMKLKANDIVYDIGTGTGSIAVQIGMLSHTVKVFALECNPTAVALIKQNITKAGLYNIDVIERLAPEGLAGLPKADVAFIGGSKGKLEEILHKLYEINPSMRVVINAVSLESISEMKRILETLCIENLSIKQLSVNTVKKLGDYQMLSANNPVFIYSFDFLDKVE